MGTQRAIRMVAAMAGVALATSGCTFMRQVSHPTATGGGAADDRPSVSADGRYVAYSAISDTTAPGLAYGVYRYDTVTGTRVLVSVAPGGAYPDDASGEPAISGNGRYVAFSSDATNLVPNDTNDETDVFVRDMVTNTTTRVSVDASGNEVSDPSYTPSISTDGNVVAFISESDDLSPADDNLDSDAYVVNRTTHSVTLASIAGGIQSDFGISEAVISGNGQFLAFTTDTDLVASDQNLDDDVYVRNLVAKTSTRISRPKNGNVEGGGGWSPSMSADGRYVAYVGYSDADGAADPYPGVDVFVRDTSLSTVTRISVGPTNGFVDGAAFDPIMSSDGKRVIFLSSGNVTGTDTNGATFDAFVRDLNVNRTYLVSTDMLLAQSTANTTLPTISADGRYAVFQNPHSLHYDDTNAVPDVYVRAIDIPVVTSISPTTAARGATVTLTINGTSFLNGATVIPLDDSFVVTGSTFVNEKKITVTIKVSATANTGKLTLYVRNPGSGPGVNGGAVGQCTNCLTVT